MVFRSVKYSRLGYDVVDKGPGPATPDAFYALAGVDHQKRRRKNSLTKPIMSWKVINI